MIPTPPPSPVDVFVHSGTAEWWQILAALSPLAVLFAAVIAAIIGLLTLRQRTRADMRSEWWARARWALDASMSEDPRRAEIGLGIMAVLAESKLASAEEIEIVAVAGEEPLEVAEKLMDRGWTVKVDGGPKPGENETTTAERSRRLTMITQESDSVHGAHAAAKVEADNAGFEHIDADVKIATRPASTDRGVQIAAARLRLVTDRRLDRSTPDWVKHLAAEKPHRHTP